MNHHDYFSSRIPMTWLLSQLDITQKELAEKMGIKQPNISRAKRTKVSVEFLRRVADACGYELILSVRKRGEISTPNLPT